MAAAGGARLADTASSLQLAAAVRRAAGCAVCAGATTPRLQPAMPMVLEYSEATTVVEPVLML